MLNLLHLERLGVNACRGLLAENVLSGAQSVDCDRLVHEVGRADAYRVDLGIVQDDAVIVDRASALVFLNCFLRLRLDDVAEILDLRIVTLHVGRDVSRVCNTAASDHSDLDFFHIGFSP